MTEGHDRSLATGRFVKGNKAYLKSHWSRWKRRVKLFSELTDLEREVVLEKGDEETKAALAAGTLKAIRPYKRGERYLLDMSQVATPALLAQLYADAVRTAQAAAEEFHTPKYLIEVLRLGLEYTVGRPGMQPPDINDEDYITKLRDTIRAFMDLPEGVEIADDGGIEVTSTATRVGD